VKGLEAMSELKEMVAALDHTYSMLQRTPKPEHVHPHD
jgi:hypothetical protein